MTLYLTTICFRDNQEDIRQMTISKLIDLFEAKESLDWIDSNLSEKGVQQTIYDRDDEKSKGY